MRLRRHLRSDWIGSVCLALGIRAASLGRRPRAATELLLQTYASVTLSDHQPAPHIHTFRTFTYTSWLRQCPTARSIITTSKSSDNQVNMIVSMCMRIASLQTCTMTTRNVPSIRRMRGILSKPINTLDLCLYSVC